MTRQILAFTLACCAGQVIVVSEARAQTAAENRCKLVLDKKSPGLTDDPANQKGYCNQLAGLIYTDVTSGPMDKLLSTRALRVSDVFSQRDVQNRKTQSAAPGGTVAQGEALPGVQPAGVAAGTIAALGTRAGQDAIAALSVNPAVLFLAETAREGLAKASRVSDVTVYVPISGVTPTADSTSSTSTGTPKAVAAPASATNELRYVGVRVRLNFLGLGAGDEVWAAAERILLNQASESAKFQATLADVLGKVPDVQKCVDAFDPKAPDPPAGSPPACDAVDVNWNLSESEMAKLREELGKVRRKADAKYLGADIRYDFGDPTLGEVEDARGKYLFAGLAAGFRADDGVQRTTTGVRGRLGIRHAHLDAVAKSELSIEGGVGIEVARRLDDDAEVNISGAVEFRKGGTPETIPNAKDLFQTEFAMLRGSIVLPVTKANSISINVGQPIWGDVSPIFSVNFNWGLLLSDRPGR